MGALKWQIGGVALAGKLGDILSAIEKHPAEIRSHNMYFLLNLVTHRLTVSAIDIRPPKYPHGCIVADHDRRLVERFAVKSGETPLPEKATTSIAGSPSAARHVIRP